MTDELVIVDDIHMNCGMHFSCFQLLQFSHSTQSLYLQAMQSRYTGLLTSCDKPPPSVNDVLTLSVTQSCL